MVCELIVYVTCYLLFRSLNPCFNGIWSASLVTRDDEDRRELVLILVLMEYGLRGLDDP